MAIHPYANLTSAAENDLSRLRREIESTLMNNSVSGRIDKDFVSTKLEMNFVYTVYDIDLVNRLMKNEFLRSGWVNIEFRLDVDNVLRIVILTRD